MKFTNTDHPVYQQLLGKARDAKRGGEGAWSVQSTGEKLAVALVLNRPEWIAGMGYSLAEAIDRAGILWVSCVMAVARELKAEECSDRDD